MHGQIKALLIMALLALLAIATVVVLVIKIVEVEQCYDDGGVVVAPLSRWQECVTEGSNGR